MATWHFLKINRATKPFLIIDMRHGDPPPPTIRYRPTQGVMGPVSVGLDLNYTPSDICHGNNSSDLRKGTSFSYREGLSSREMYLKHMSHQTIHHRQKKTADRAQQKKRPIMPSIFKNSLIWLSHSQRSTNTKMAHWLQCCHTLPGAPPSGKSLQVDSGSVGL